MNVRKRQPSTHPVHIKAQGVARASVDHYLYGQRHKRRRPSVTARGGFGMADLFNPLGALGAVVKNQISPPNDGTNGQLSGQLGNIKDSYWDRLKVMIMGRTDVPAAVKTILQQYGSQRIVSANICRKPVMGLMTSAGNALSAGELDKKLQELGYDGVFHLFAIVVLEDGTRIKLEKNERLNWEVVQEDHEGDYRPIDCQGDNLMSLMKKALDKYGQKLIQYRLDGTNCQHFIMSFFEPYMTPELRDFTYQDVQSIFQSLPVGTSTAVNYLTDLGARLSGMFGAGGKRRRRR